MCLHLSGSRACNDMPPFVFAGVTEDWLSAGAGTGANVVELLTVFGLLIVAEGWPLVGRELAV